MTHIMTAREFADHAGFCVHHSTDDYNMAEVIAQSVEAIKVAPDDEAPHERYLATLERHQMAAAIGELLTLIAMHELAQEQREGAFDER